MKQFNSICLPNLSKSLEQSCYKDFSSSITVLDSRLHQEVLEENPMKRDSMRSFSFKPSSVILPDTFTDNAILFLHFPGAGVLLFFLCK